LLRKNISVSTLLFHNKKYLSSKAAGELGGYTHDYIGKLCREGTLTCERVGRAWFVEEDSLRAFIITQEHNKAVLKDKLKESRKVEYAQMAVPSTVASVHNVPVVVDYTPALEQPVANISFNTLPLEPEGSTSSQFVKPALSPRVILSEKIFAFVLACVVVITGYTVSNGAVAERVGGYAQNVLRSAVAAANATPEVLAKRVARMDTLLYNSDNITRAALTQPASVFTGAQAHAGALAFAFADGINTLWGTLSNIGNHAAGSFFTYEGSAVGKVEVTVREVPTPSAVDMATVPAVPAQLHAARTATSVSTNNTATSGHTVITQPIVERIIERIVQQPVAAQTLTPIEIQTKLDILENELRKEIFSMSAANDTRPVDNFRMIALSQKIDQLDGTTITHATISASSLTVSGTATFNGSVTFVGDTNISNLTLSGQLGLAVANVTVCAVVKVPPLGVMLGVAVVGSTTWLFTVIVTVEVLIFPAPSRAIAVIV
jgi:hypothetical protein